MNNNTNSSIHFSAKHRGANVTAETVNPHVKKIEYAVRGPIVIRAGEIEKEIKSAKWSRDFNQVVRANIGDCHAVGQTPITFIRQVLACCVDPSLLETDRYNDDVKLRAKEVLGDCRGHSMGAYTDSVGLEAIRRNITRYIEERDGHPSDINNIFLSTGATEAIKAVLRLIQTGKDGTERAGVMIPIPQYPLYSATLTDYNACQIPYYLDEANHWGLTETQLTEAFDKAKGQCVPRALVIINPGNPTGQVLSRENIESIIRFAKRNGLCILADEVYQHNVYAEGKEFHSFKKVLTELGSDFDDLELASFMSVSKGWMGECGLRGGYCELVNFSSDVQAFLWKYLSANLCSNTIGQAAVNCVVHTPMPGEESFVSFDAERSKVLTDLKYKANLVTKTFNSIEGIQCNEVQGAMYAFPRLTLPQKAIDEAKKRQMSPDALYCFDLLESTGICVVPGSGFGQLPNTYHFRTTILPPVADLEKSMQKFKEFHFNFLAKYA